MLDKPDTIRRKVRRAVTDSSDALAYEPANKPGVSNLADITATLTGRTPTDVLEDCAGYGDLKNICADALIAELEPIQKRHDELMADQQALQCILARGADRARAVAAPILTRAQQAFGV